MSSFPPRIFLLSPARLDGKRAHLLFHPVTMFPVARALRLMEGAAPVWRFWAFCLWAEESRFPDANRFL